jgi:hypothetical protein
MEVALNVPLGELIADKAQFAQPLELDGVSLVQAETEPQEVSASCSRLKRQYHDLAEGISVRIQRKLEEACKYAQKFASRLTPHYHQGGQNNTVRSTARQSRTQRRTTRSAAKASSSSSDGGDSTPPAPYRHFFVIFVVVLLAVLLLPLADHHLSGATRPRPELNLSLPASSLAWDVIHFFLI